MLLKNNIFSVMFFYGSLNFKNDKNVHITDLKRSKYVLERCVRISCRNLFSLLGNVSTITHVTFDTRIAFLILKCSCCNTIEKDNNN